MSHSRRIVLGLAILMATWVGCGLDGISGQLVRMDGNYYVLRTSNGKEITLYVNKRTRMDEVTPGDDIHAYIGKDGHAEFVQRLEK